MYEFFNKQQNSIIFCYLCGVKEDYAYNIAHNFKKAIDENIWNKENLKINSYLHVYSNTYKILKNFKANNAIFASKERDVKNKIQKFYKINPEIFIDDKILENGEIREFMDQNYRSFTEFKGKSDKEILLNALNLCYFDYSMRPLEAISELNKWKKFDFFTILNFNHFLLTKHVTEFKPKNHEESNRFEQIDLKELSLLFLVKYFNTYKDNYFLNAYREDF